MTGRRFFSLSGVYALPFKQNILVKGWQMSGGLTAQSGSPWNVTVGFDQAGNVVAGSERPNLIMPANQIITGNVTQWANPAGFGLPAPGTLGNLQRDFLAGPGTVDLDYAVMKDTPIKEQVRLQFRAEFFNLSQPPQLRPAQCERVRADCERRRCSEPDVRQDHGDHHVVPADSVCVEASVLILGGPVTRLFGKTGPYLWAGSSFLRVADDRPGAAMRAPS